MTLIPTRKSRSIVTWNSLKSWTWQNTQVSIWKANQWKKYKFKTPIKTKSQSIPSIRKTFSIFEVLSFMQDMQMQVIITLSLRTMTNGMNSMMSLSGRPITQKFSKKDSEGTIRTLLMSSRSKSLRTHTFCFTKDKRLRICHKFKNKNLNKIQWKKKGKILT